MWDGVEVESVAPTVYDIEVFARMSVKYIHGQYEKVENGVAHSVIYSPTSGSRQFVIISFSVSREKEPFWVSF